MTRKDYELIARAIRETRDFTGVHQVTLNEVTATLALFLGKDNPRFDAPRFLQATQRT